MENFEKYLTHKSDEVDNAAYALITAIARTEKEIEWDMEIIGEVVDAVKSVLDDFNVPVCHPFFADETPCYKTSECQNRNCPFKQKEEK